MDSAYSVNITSFKLRKLAKLFHVPFFILGSGSMGPLLTATLGAFLRATNGAVVISLPHRTESHRIASTHNLLEFRDTLPVEERSRVEARVPQSQEAQDAAGVAALPLLPPDPIRKREWT
jgi:hypothetical protein